MVGELEGEVGPRGKMLNHDREGIHQPPDQALEYTLYYYQVQASRYRVFITLKFVCSAHALCC